MRVCCIPAGTGGVAFYRIIQPYTKLRELGVDVFIFNKERHDALRLRSEQEIADIIVFQCPWSQGILDAVRLIKKGSKFGKYQKVVVEMDDDLFNVNPLNEKYNLFGIDEAIMVYHDKESQERFLSQKTMPDWIDYWTKPNGELHVKIWRDGFGDFSIKDNIIKYEATAQLLSECDLLTVTTSELGKKLREHRPTGPIAVIPNCVDPSRWLPMKKGDPSRIRIGWQGGSAHFADIHMIGSQLIDIMRKYDNVDFCYMGTRYDSIFAEAEDLHHRIKYFEWHGDVATYPLVVRDMELDIGLCPLIDDSFNNGKSEIKYLEYSIMEIPSIVSPVVYGSVVKHGKTGLVVDKGGWFRAMEQLVIDESKRKSLANHAKANVDLDYSLDRYVGLKDALCDLLK